MGDIEAPEAVSLAPRPDLMQEPFGGAIASAREVTVPDRPLLAGAEPPPAIAAALAPRGRKRSAAASAQRRRRRVRAPTRPDRGGAVVDEKRRRARVAGQARALRPRRRHLRADRHRGARPPVRQPQHEPGRACRRGIGNGSAPPGRHGRRDDGSADPLPTATANQAPSRPRQPPPAAADRDRASGDRDAHGSDHDAGRRGADAPAAPATQLAAADGRTVATAAPPSAAPSRLRRGRRDGPGAATQPRRARLRPCRWPRPAARRRIPGATPGACTEILQKASLEKITPAETDFFKRECK